jgi:hypothetical protein
LSLRLYMDEHVPSAISAALRTRGVDVLTVQEDGFTGAADGVVMNRAAELGRILVSEDEDMIREAIRRLRAGESFGGLFRGTGLIRHIGRAVADLELAAKVYEPRDILGRVEWIPLR